MFIYDYCRYLCEVLVLQRKYKEKMLAAQFPRKFTIIARFSEICR